MNQKLYIYVESLLNKWKFIYIWVIKLTSWPAAAAPPLPFPLPIFIAFYLNEWKLLLLNSTNAAAMNERAEKVSDFLMYCVSIIIMAYRLHPEI